MESNELRSVITAGDRLFDIQMIWELSCSRLTRSLAVYHQDFKISFVSMRRRHVQLLDRLRSLVRLIKRQSNVVMYLVIAANT